MAMMSASRVFLFLLLAFIAGVAAASFLDLSVLIPGGISVFGIFLASIFWRKKTAVLAGFLILAFAFGVWRFQAVSQKEDLAGVWRYNNQGKFLIKGEIAGESDHRDFNQRFVFKAREIEVGGDWRPVFGKILVTGPRFPEYQYGDKLEISGKIAPPENFEDFDYAAYLAKDDIFSVIKYPEIEKIGGAGFSARGILFEVKRKFRETLGLILPEPHSSFLAALTLGARKTLPPELIENFNITGTTHIIALSGFHIAIFSSFMIGLLTFFLIRRGAAFWISVLAIAAFTLMTGAMASVTRAALMGVLVLWAQRESRLYAVGNALVFAAALMLFFNPKILRWDAAFQLSFLATLGLAYISPIFGEKFAPAEIGKIAPRGLAVKAARKIKEVFYLTLSAQIATLPLILFHFGRLSLVALPANLAVLLAIPLTMFFGFLAGGIGLISVFLGKIAASPAFILLSYEMAAINLFAKIPWASVPVYSFSIFWVIIAYAALIFWVFKWRQKTRKI